VNPEQQLALLQAFAKSKQYEFQGFKAMWLLSHPETEEPVPVVVEPVAEPAVPQVVAEVPVEEEKPKRKRKAAEEDAST